MEEEKGEGILELASPLHLLEVVVSPYIQFSSLPISVSSNNPF